MANTSLLERARNYVAKMPAAISGSAGHDATIHVACVLVQGFDLSRADARALLDEFNARCEPPWSDRELEHKLNQADKMQGLMTRDGMQSRGCLAADIERDDTPRESVPPSKAPAIPLPRPVPVKATFKAEALKGFALRWRPVVDTHWLAQRSPIVPRTMSHTLTAEEYLAAVFREGERVVCFTNQESQGQAMWPLQKPPESGDEGVWYLCQPVDGMEYVNPRAGVNKDGSPKMSRRSAESVISWRHLVLESDEADARDWMAALVQLPIPIVAIYTSGGRSIHAIVQVNAKTEGDWNGIVSRIRPLFIELGADRRAMSAVRLTRLPGCWRGDRLQKLLYLNPSPSPTEKICERAPAVDILALPLSVLGNAMKFSPAEVKEQEGWEDVLQFVDLLEWYETAPKAAEMLKQVCAWMGGQS